MRVLAIALMCVTMVCFTGQDTCAKWLSASLPIVQIVWARYVGAAVIALVASRSLSRPAMLRSKRPRLQLLRSVLALRFDDRERVRRPPAPAVGDRDNLVSHAGLRRSSCRTCAGRKGERGTHDRNRARISRRGDRDAPGNGGISADRSRRCRRRCLQFADTCWPPASSLARTRRRRRSRGRKSPASCFSLRYCRGFGSSLDQWEFGLVMAVMGVFGAASHGMLIVAHRYAPAPTLTPFTYTQLIWMIISGVVVFGDWPAPATLVGAALGRRLRRLSRGQRAQRTACRDEP